MSRRLARQPGSPKLFTERHRLLFADRLSQEDGLCLVLDLAELDGSHPCAIGSKLAGGVFFEADEQVFRRGGCEGGEEFLFEDSEGAFEGFKVIGGCCVLSRGARVAAHGFG